MSRYTHINEVDDADALRPPYRGRREFRKILVNPYDKEVQGERVAPAVRYLRSRFKKTLAMTYNDISGITGHAYGHIQSLLTQGTASPTFFDMALLADAAGTSLDFLAARAGLLHPQRITNPTHRDMLNEQENLIIAYLRQIPDTTIQHAVARQMLETAQATAVASATPPRKRRGRQHTEDPDATTAPPASSTTPPPHTPHN